MNVTEALKAIQDSNELPNRSEIYGAISGAIASLEDTNKGLALERDKLRDNNADLLKQKNQASRKVTDLQKTLDEILAEAGVDPSDDEEKKKQTIKGLREKITELEKKLDVDFQGKDKEINELKEQLTGMTTRAIAAEKTSKVQAIASTLKLDSTALLQALDWLQVPVDSLLTGEKIAIKDGEKEIPIQDYLKSKSPFLANALFSVPQVNGNENGNTSDSGNDTDKKDNPPTGDDKTTTEGKGEGTQGEQKPDQNGNGNKPSAPPTGTPSPDLVGKYFSSIGVGYKVKK